MNLACNIVEIPLKTYSVAMKNEKYSMSFTTGSLLHLESVRIAGLFMKLEDWNKVRDLVRSENLLQARTQNTARRVCSEIISRLKMLSTQELALLAKGTALEQGYLLWLAVCRRYRFIADFATLILGEHASALKTKLFHEDFDSFFNKKSEWHPELDAIRPATRSKLRQILFKILREANLLAADNTIQAALLSPCLLEILAKERPQELLFFPGSDSDPRN